MPHRKCSIVISAIVSKAVIAILFISSALAESQTFKVAPLIHLTGDYAMQGNAIREGLDLAAMEINQSGGVAGRNVELIFEDTHYDAKLAVSAAKHAVEINGAVAAMVMTFTETEALAPYFEKKQVPLISLWDSSPQIEQLGHYTFGFGPWTPGSGDTAAKFTTEKLKTNSAVTIATIDDWSLHAVDLYKESLSKLGGKVALELTQAPADSDFRTVISRAARSGATVLYAPIAVNIPAFFRQLSEQRFPLPVITSDVLTDEIIRESNGAVEGVYQTQPATPERPATKRMEDAYEKRFKKKCSMTTFVAWGYDALKLLALAETNATSRAGILTEELYKIADYDGASGNITIDAAGSAKKPISMYQVQKGQLNKVD